MSKRKPTKSEIYQRIYKLEYEKDQLEIKRSMIKEYFYGYSKYDRSLEANLKRMDGPKEVFDKWESEHRYGYGNRDGYVDKYVETLKLKEPWPKKNELQNKITAKQTLIEGLILQRKKEISGLKSRWLGIKSESNRNLKGDSIRDKIINRSQEKIADFRYCTNTGREIKIDFKLFRKDPNQTCGPTQEVAPITFSEIAIAKIGGYLFDSNFLKKKKATSSVWHYKPYTDGTGLVYLANKPNATQEIKDEAQKFLAKMKDSIYCDYIDTGKRSSFKIKDIYTLKPSGKEPVKRINKKVLKLKKIYKTLEFDNIYTVTKRSYGDYEGKFKVGCFRKLGAKGKLNNMLVRSIFEPYFYLGGPKTDEELKKELDIIKATIDSNLERHLNGRV
jgi:hypothetical protein